MKAITFLLLIPVFILTTPNLFAQEAEFGLASYYSDDFHGRKTAYGDYYDKGKLTAAHKKFKYGTKIRVTRLDNNKSVVVTVTDKGPYIKGRVVDLSRRAAESIGLVADGVAQVKVEVVGRSSSSPQVAATKKPATTTPKSTPAPKPTTTQTERSAPKSYDQTALVTQQRKDNLVAKEAKTTEKSEVKRNNNIISTAKGKVIKREDLFPTAAPEAAAASSTTTAKSVAPAASRPTSYDNTPAPAQAQGEIKFKMVQQDYNKYGLYKIVLQKPEQRGYGVQIVSLSNYENVLKQVADLQAKWFDNILVSVEKGGETPKYKVILGPFLDQQVADKYRLDLIRKYKIKGFVVDLSTISYE